MTEARTGAARHGGGAVRLEPVARESTPALIARILRGAIARGDFPPGSQLGESALAAQLGVSRGPLREAMQRLTQEGLLISHRNRGLFVPELTAEAVEDMYLLRRPLEEAAARQILRRGDPVTAGRRLARAAEAMAEFADRPDDPEMVEADLAFHRELVELSGSPRLMRVHETVLVETSMCLHAMGRSYGPGEDRVAEHLLIAEAIGDRDEAGTMVALDAHMRDGLARLTDPAA